MSDLSNSFEATLMEVFSAMQQDALRRETQNPNEPAEPPDSFMRMLSELGAGGSSFTVSNSATSLPSWLPPPTFRSTTNGNHEIQFQFSIPTGEATSPFIQQMRGMEAFFNEMFQNLNSDESTSKSAIEQFEKVIIDNTDRGGDVYSVKKLKEFLNAVGVPYSDFLEKKEFVDALSKKVCFRPFTYCFADCSSTCTICACEIKEDELITKLPCGHWFHHGQHQETADSNTDAECLGITKWLSQQSTCPNCKAKLPKQSDVESNGSTEVATVAAEPPATPPASSVVSVDETPQQEQDVENLHSKPEISPPDGSKRQKSS